MANRPSTVPDRSQRHIVIAVTLILLLAAVSGVWWWMRGRAFAGPAWQGYAEADFVKVGPVEAGLLVSVSVARGDWVDTGVPLFAQDQTGDRAARDQAARQLSQAEEQLANLKSGGKPTEVEQAEANLADARATVTRTEADLHRGEAQVRMGGISQQNLDQLRADYLSAQAKVRVAAAALAQMRAPLGREREVSAQSAAVEAARAALAMAEWRLQQRRVVAPVSGRVADVLARPGETVAANVPVVSLLPPANIFVRFFVPEIALGSVHRGDRVALSCDSCPAGLGATISFIAPQAEYTPPVIYSEATQSKLVFMIEARPSPDQAALLNPGQPIVVRPYRVATP